MSKVCGCPSLLCSPRARIFRSGLAGPGPRHVERHFRAQTYLRQRRSTKLEVLTHPPGSPMESRLLEILVCPLCKSSLRHDRQRQELICRADRLAFPIRDGVPILLESEARELPATGGLRSEDTPSSHFNSPEQTPQADDRS